MTASLNKPGAEYQHLLVNNNQLRSSTPINEPYEQRKQHLLGSYDFVFGWSPGHSGTTALSDPSQYGHPEDVIFLHESRRCEVMIENIQKKQWIHMSYFEEYKFVKESYFPFLERCKGSKRTLADFGHHNVFFVDALINYLHYETNLTFLFVRIRRPRLEVALSLTYNQPMVPFADVCQGLEFRFCPFDRQEGVILKLDMITWWRLSEYQKTLWMVDEMELRWQRMIAQHPYLHTTEVFWSKSDGEQSFQAVVTRLARVLNTTVAPKSDRYHMKVATVHAGGNSDIFLHGGKLVPVDRNYKRMMGYGESHTFGQIRTLFRFFILSALVVLIVLRCCAYNVSSWKQKLANRHKSTE